MQRLVVVFLVGLVAVSQGDDTGKNNYELARYPFKGTLCFSLFWMSARIRFRPRITKKNMWFFFAQRAHWIVADFRKKRLITGDKKTFRKKQVYFRR